MNEESDITKGIEKVKKNLGLVAAVASMPVTACAVMGIGIGTGYVIGNIVDHIPLLKEAAPAIAHYTGLIKEMKIDNLNEDLFQTALGIAGFLFGLRAPFYWREGWRVAAQEHEEELKKNYELGRQHGKEFEELETML
jgi:hypothetical protein